MLRVLCSQQSNANRRFQLLADTLLLAINVGNAHRIQWDGRVHHVLRDGNEDDSPQADLKSQNGLDIVHKWLGQNDQKRERARMGLHRNAGQELTR